MNRALFSALLLAAIGAGWLSVEFHQQAHDEWIAYRAAHHCKDIGATAPPAGIGTAPGKTAWLCDDQLIHTHDTE
jgi:hypothetical protein